MGLGILEPHGTSWDLVRVGLRETWRNLEELMYLNYILYLFCVRNSVGPLEFKYLHAFLSNTPPRPFHLPPSTASPSSLFDTYYVITYVIHRRPSLSTATTSTASRSEHGRKENFDVRCFQRGRVTTRRREERLTAHTVTWVRYSSTFS
jgi:hypothetical protein